MGKQTGFPKKNMKKKKEIESPNILPAIFFLEKGPFKIKIYFFGLKKKYSIVNQSRSIITITCNIGIGILQINIKRWL